MKIDLIYSSLSIIFFKVKYIVPQYDDFIVS